MVNNALYKPPSKSTDLGITDSELGSLPDPVKRTVGKVRGKCVQRKHVTLREDLESVTESDGELTSFKKVMGKILVNDTNPTPMPKGKEQGLVTYEDSATESDDPPAKLMHALKASTATGSNSKCIQPNQTTNRQKLKPASLVPDPSQPMQSESKSIKPKSDEMKLKEALKDAQEAFRKAQEAQKKVREDVRRVKENAKELSVCNCIKALNNKVEACQSHLSQMSKGSKITTH